MCPFADTLLVTFEKFKVLRLIWDTSGRKAQFTLNIFATGRLSLPPAGSIFTSLLSMSEKSFAFQLH